MGCTRRRAWPTTTATTSATAVQRASPTKTRVGTAAMVRSSASNGANLSELPPDEQIARGVEGAARQFDDPRGAAPLPRLTTEAAQRAPGRVTLPAPAATAWARRPGGVDLDVADLACKAVSAPVEAAAEYQTAP